MRFALICLLVAGAAQARYQKPHAAETRFLVAQEWTLAGERLVLGEKRYPIDLFWLADRINSQLICAGGYAQGMRRYLRELDRTSALIVELVAKKKGGPRFVAGLWPLTQKRVENDLALVVKLTGPGHIKAGTRIPLEITLENRSKVAHTVVLPNDGSESGWREPHTLYSASRDGRKLESQALPRCGMYAEDWHRDVVTIAPGKSLDLTERYTPPRFQLDLSRPGTVQLRAHYAYRGGLSRGAKGKSPGPMGKMPAFELVSKPLEIEIR